MPRTNRPAAAAPATTDTRAVGDLATGVATELNAVARRIREQYERSLRSWVEIGKGLVRARELLNGDARAWTAWVRDSLGWSERHARNFVFVAEFVEAQEGTRKRVSELHALPPTSVLEIARAPEPVRAVIIGRLRAGKKPSVGQIRSLVREARRAPAPPPPVEADTGEESAAVEDERILAEIRTLADRLRAGGRSLAVLRATHILLGDEADQHASEIVDIRPPEPPTAPVVVSDPNAVEVARDLARAWCVHEADAIAHALHHADGLYREIPPPERFDGGRAAANFVPRMLSFFSGSEGAFHAAAKAMGWNQLTTAQFEPGDNVQTAAEILGRRLDAGVQHLGDMMMVRPDHFGGGFDLCVGGPPCQSFSQAGKGEGLASDKGDLSRVYFDLCARMPVRVSRASIGGVPVLIFENVPSLVVSADRRDDFGILLGLAAGLPDGIRPRCERWPEAGLLVGGDREVGYRVLDASKFGSVQARHRLYVVTTRRGDGISTLRCLYDEPIEPGPVVWVDGPRALHTLDNRGRGPADPAKAPSGALAGMLVRDRSRELARRPNPRRATGNTPEGGREKDPHVFLLTRFQCAKRAANPNTPGWLRVLLETAAEEGVGADYPEQLLLDRLGEENRREYEAIMARQRDAVYIHWISRQGGQLSVCERTVNTVTRHFGNSKAERSFVIRRGPAEDGTPHVWVRASLPEEIEQIMGVRIDWTKIEDWRWGAGQDDRRIQVLGNSLSSHVISWLCENIDREMRAAIRRGDYLPDRRVGPWVYNAFVRRMDALYVAPPATVDEDEGDPTEFATEFVMSIHPPEPPRPRAMAETTTLALEAAFTAPPVHLSRPGAERWAREAAGAEVEWRARVGRYARLHAAALVEEEARADIKAATTDDVADGTAKPPPAGTKTPPGRTGRRRRTTT